MADNAELDAIVIRVGSPGAAPFQLRKGEEGLSVFDPRSVDPPLTETEILECFRDGSLLIDCPIKTILGLGLRIESMEGANVLSERVRIAHREIRPGDGMTRTQFKAALKGLE
jgi:hypothetical protein